MITIKARNQYITDKCGDSQAAINVNIVGSANYKCDAVFSKNSYSEFISDFRDMLDNVEDADTAYLSNDSVSFCIARNGELHDETEEAAVLVSRKDLISIYKQFTYINSLKDGETLVVNIVPEYDKCMGDYELRNEIDRIVSYCTGLLHSMGRCIEQSDPSIIHEDIDYIKKQMNELSAIYDKWNDTKEEFK